MKQKKNSKCRLCRERYEIVKLQHKRYQKAVANVIQKKNHYELEATCELRKRFMFEHDTRKKQMSKKLQSVNALQV